VTTPELPADLLDQLIDAGNKELNDYYHERACACSAWPGACLTPGITPGEWDTSAFAIGLPAVIAAYEQAKAQRAATAEAATGPVKDGWDAGQRLHALYGTHPGKGRVIRTGRNLVLGWLAYLDSGAAFYILKDGTHAGPFGTDDGAVRDAKRKADQ
jgi:hypothetical protein